MNIANIGVPAFLLTRQWLDTEQGLRLIFWFYSDAGPLRLQIDGEKPVLFLRQQDQIKLNILCNRWPSIELRPVDLCNFEGEALSAVYAPSQNLLRKFKLELKRISVPSYEADVKPHDRYLMERFITGPVTLHSQTKSVKGQPNYAELGKTKLTPSQYSPNNMRWMSIDLECEYLPGQDILSPHSRLYSIACYCESHQRVFILEKASAETYTQTYSTEAELLQGFIAYLREQDPDFIIGWNVIDFDLRYLQAKCDQHQVAFNIGRGDDELRWIKRNDSEKYLLLMPGRVVLDGIEMLRTATHSFESFALEAVAQELLGQGKKIADVDDKAAEINRLYEHDIDALVRYNLQDCILVWQIFEKTQLLEFALQRAKLTGLAVDRVGGSVAAFDNLYLPRLHRQGFVALNTESVVSLGAAPGGYVMDSKPGLYKHVLVLDFKSLYPSIIRTFQVDPLALVTASLENCEDAISGYEGARFKRDVALLPKIITELWQARDEAKRSKNTAFSQAIKIIMNSFYGVLGTPGCRFYDARLVNSITRRGHEILTKSRDWIAGQGYETIYGDTDSIFIWLENCESDQQAKAIGKTLASGMNQWWQDYMAAQFSLPSHLEMEFETHFAQFFMPTIRGTQLGSKKRYAGWIKDGSADGRLLIKGLEAVRSDWTPLARQFQLELYTRYFRQQPYKDYVKEIYRGLLSGDYDAQLVYRRRLRRPLQEYQKNIPPHAQAAALEDAWRVQQGLSPRYQYGGWVQYVMTRQGAVPLRFAATDLDYQHYLDKQLAPVADALLHLTGESFESLTQAQMGLF